MSSAPVVGVGHSIGATVLLMLAGARGFTGTGEPVTVPPERRISKLALMAPATDFFRAAGALDDVSAQIGIWVGGKDLITPPASAQVVSDALRGRRPARVLVTPGAGHFSFMNHPPPHVTDVMADRETFLCRLADEIAEFVRAG